MKKGPNEPSEEVIDALITRFRSSHIYDGMDTAHKIELELAVSEGDQEVIEGLTRILDRADTNLQMVEDFQGQVVEALAEVATQDFVGMHKKALKRSQRLEDVALSEAAAREAEQLQIELLLDDNKNKN